MGHAHELDCLVQNRSFMINCDHVELMVTAGQDVLLKTKSGGILVPKPNTFSDSFEKWFVNTANFLAAGICDQTCVYEQKSNVPTVTLEHPFLKLLYEIVEDLNTNVKTWGYQFSVGNVNGGICSILFQRESAIEAR